MNGNGSLPESFKFTICLSETKNNLLAQAAEIAKENLAQGKQSYEMEMLGTFRF